MAATASRHHHSPFDHARLGLPLLHPSEAPGMRTRMASCRPLCPGMLLAQHPEGFDTLTWQWHELEPAATWASSSGSSEGAASAGGWEGPSGANDTSDSSRAGEGNSSVGEVPPLESLLLRSGSSSDSHRSSASSSSSDTDQDSKDWQLATFDPALHRHLSSISEHDSLASNSAAEGEQALPDPVVNSPVGSMQDRSEAAPDAAGSARTCPRTSTGGSRAGTGPDGWDLPMRAMEELIQDLKSATEVMQASQEEDGSSGPGTPTAAAAAPPQPSAASELPLPSPPNSNAGPAAEPSFDNDRLAPAAALESPAAPAGRPAPEAEPEGYTSTSNNPQLFSACWADVRRSFQAWGSGQLTVHRGEQVLVLAEDEDGWLTVERASGPQGGAVQGTIPAACAVLEAASP